MISFSNFLMPAAWWSKLHSCSSGSRWLLQYTNPHLHSMPSSPVFLLQLKHRFRSFCLGYSATSSMVSTVSLRAGSNATSSTSGCLSRISSFLGGAFFLGKGTST